MRSEFSKVELQPIYRTVFSWTVKTWISFAYIKEKRTDIFDVKSEEELGNVFYILASRHENWNV